MATVKMMGAALVLAALAGLARHLMQRRRDA
jgi:MYXO-CTERM domain-containing protein